MKYVLKRDLPFAKAGTEVGIFGRLGCTPLVVYSSKSVDIGKEYVDLFIAEGWIEEKSEPREWWLGINETGGNSTSYPLLKKDDLVNEYDEVIKIREVL